jgi:hypothetical protein
MLQVPSRPMRKRTSLRQHNPASLYLTHPDPRQHSAMRTMNCRFAGNGEPQVRLIARIDSFLKCNELPAF